MRVVSGVFAGLCLLGLGHAVAEDVVTLPEITLPTTVTSEAPEEKKADKDAKPKKDEPLPNPWAKVPPVRPFPRLGYSFVPPTGPGYYSLLDVLLGNYREKPPRYIYSPIAPVPPSFFDADFRYLEDPKNTDHDWSDCLHRIHLGDHWLLATGGQFSWRHMHEINSRLTGRNVDYELLRTRVWGDVWYEDRLRLFVEYLDAHTFNLDLPPLLIDVDRSDLLNAFVDVKVGEIRDRPVYVRVGRQEMLFGSQRLITTLDWANTRRTFQGVRAFRPGEKFDVDLFWVQPVIPDPSNFDSVDNDRNFAGIWTTYRREKGWFFDAYYLFLDDTSPARVLGEPAAVAHHVHTLGTRWTGTKHNWLWDVELMFQLGDRGPQTIVAGAASLGGGYNFANCPLNPTFWVYYDFASGDANPGQDSTYSTFNQLFNFGHYYLGWLDLVGRQNIHDVSAHLYLYPQKWITVWLQFHHFRLASATDALYSAGGVPLRRDTTGRAGSDVGNEIDLVLNFHLGPHSDILTGYSQLFAGDFIRNTAASAAAARSPELFYLMYSFRW